MGVCQSSIKRIREKKLRKAARRNDVESLLRQIHAGVDVNATNVRGETALMIAADAGSSHCVIALLRSSALADLRCSRGRTALWYAARKGWEICLLALLGAGDADPNVPDPRSLVTPLMLAAGLGLRECVITEFLESGADVNAMDRNGHTALNYAINAQRYKLAQRLIQCGAVLCVKLNVGPDSPLLKSLPEVFVPVAAGYEADTEEGRDGPSPGGGPGPSSVLHPKVPSTVLTT